ncbi:uncharacterized protein [Euphorbia lathyris]|uniref:uncharacterized protein n=1 Tax=Euphorbia lathyris TaxID=212925 RepID=UPI0033137C24
MENQNKFHLFAILILFVFGCSKVNGKQRVPCFFIFGDSLVDSGNNNNLATAAKVDYLPYGIDFPNGPTGRFTNGRTAADIIGELLGFKNFIPSFLNVSSSGGSDILKGVNYASGSAGIRTETGKKLGVNIDLVTQLKNHQVIISRIVDILGSESAADHLNKCLYSFVIGNNDYINNYFLPDLYNTSSDYTLEQYAQVLMMDYSQHIMSLYNSGARKVAVTGIGPIGCTPGATASSERNGKLCVDSMNQAANLFNHRLELLVDELNTDVTDAKFIYLNTYGIVEEYISTPGFGIEMQGCCKVNEYGLCSSNEDPCQHRNLRLFYDSFHPTEIANRVGAGISFLSLMKIFEVTKKSTKLDCPFKITRLSSFQRGEERSDLVTTLLIIVSKSIFVNNDNNQEKQVPCYFIFGDSLVDNGNNNNLITETKVNYPPYGIDFPDGPTGRFTNGKTSADTIGELLGFKKLIPSFLKANGSEILDGVNYASGASGILYETGKQAGDNVELTKQLQNHQVTVSRIIDLFNNNETAAFEHLNKCFYLVATGNNDYINNYFMPGYNTSTLYTPFQYAGLLMDHFSVQLRLLHALGARKVGVNSVSSIGCTPVSTILFSRKSSICVDKLNFAANFFNQRLALLLFRLNLALPGAKFLQIGSLGYEPATYIPGINNVTLSGCCELNEIGLCIPNRPVCENRRLAVFWDGFHPTEYVNKFIGTAAYRLIKATILKF